MEKSVKQKNWLNRKISSMKNLVKQENQLNGKIG